MTSKWPQNGLKMASNDLIWPKNDLKIASNAFMILENVDFISFLRYFVTILMSPFWQFLPTVTKWPQNDLKTTSNSPFIWKMRNFISFLSLFRTILMSPFCWFLPTVKTNCGHSDTAHMTGARNHASHIWLEAWVAQGAKPRAASTQWDISRWRWGIEVTTRETIISEMLTPFFQTLTRC